MDVALAMHMLYHVPDVPAAVAELRRIVKPGGTRERGTFRAVNRSGVFVCR